MPITTRKSSRASSRHYYAVALGRTVGIFEEWSRVKVSTDRISNCFKGYPTLEQAINHMKQANRGFTIDNIKVIDKRGVEHKLRKYIANTKATNNVAVTVAGNPVAADDPINRNRDNADDIMNGDPDVDDVVLKQNNAADEPVDGDINGDPNDINNDNAAGETAAGDGVDPDILNQDNPHDTLNQDNAAAGEGAAGDKLVVIPAAGANTNGDPTAGHTINHGESDILDQDNAVVVPVAGENLNGDPENQDNAAGEPVAGAIMNTVAGDTTNGDPDVAGNVINLNAAGVPTAANKEPPFRFVPKAANNVGG